MKRTIGVYVGEKAVHVGTLHFDAQGARESAAFEYQPAWLAGADLFPLSPELPLLEGPHYRKRSRDGSVFPAIIADTEPDGWSRRVILRDHAKRQQRERRSRAKHELHHHPLHSLDFLLAVDDLSRVGALRYRDEQEVWQRAPEEGRRTAPPLLELAQLLRASHAVETDSETAEDLAYLRGRGTSLGGLRPKCTVRDDDGRLSIGKFPSDGARMHYASAATLLGVEASAPEEAAYTDIVDALRVHGAEVQRDSEELWRRIAFSIAINNVDDHLLNHGFLHAGRGLWRLSPAFDINPFPDRARELKTWISPETGPEASMEALFSVVAYFRLSATRAKTIAAEVTRAVTRWRQTGKAIGMTNAELDAFAEAFER